MDEITREPHRKPIRWVGSTLKDLSRFPIGVKQSLGFALHLAQRGEKAPAAKPLHGFGGAGLLEVVEDDDGRTYRAVYTVKFAGVVYVLHAFQKKSNKGGETPHRDADLIRDRLKAAEADYGAAQAEEVRE